MSKIDHATTIRRHIQAMFVLSPFDEDDDSMVTEAYRSHLEGIQDEANGLQAERDAAITRAEEAEEKVELLERDQRKRLMRGGST